MYLVLIILNLPKIFYNTSLDTTNFPVAGQNALVRISAMFESTRYPREAR